MKNLNFGRKKRYSARSWSQSKAIKERSEPKKPGLKLHLGCGSNIIPGWVNIDSEEFPGAERLDLRKKLPFDSESADFIYSEHFIEHIDREDAESLVSECFRVLKPGGVARFSCPDLRKLIDEYLAGRTTEWAEMNWLPETPCRMVNEFFRLWGHRFMYDFEELKKLFLDSGLFAVSRVSHKISDYPELDNLESRPYHGELIIEAVKK